MSLEILWYNWLLLICALMCTTAWLSADHFTVVSLLNFEKPYYLSYLYGRGAEGPCDKSRPKLPRSGLAPETLVGHWPGECADVGIVFDALIQGLRPVPEAKGALVEQSMKVGGTCNWLFLIPCSIRPSFEYKGYNTGHKLLLGKLEVFLSALKK